MVGQSRPGATRQHRMDILRKGAAEWNANLTHRTSMTSSTVFASDPGNRSQPGIWLAMCGRSRSQRPTFTQRSGAVNWWRLKAMRAELSGAVRHALVSSDTILYTLCPTMAKTVQDLLADIRLLGEKQFQIVEAVRALMKKTAW